MGNSGTLICLEDLLKLEIGCVCILTSSSSSNYLLFLDRFQCETKSSSARGC